MVKYRDMGDGTLVNLALIGESGAFDELVERYEDAVLEKAEQIVGNSFSAEDIAQDTFFSAWEHLGELRYPTGFKTALGGRYFWLGYELAGLGRIGEAMDALGEVLNILPPSHTY